MADRVIVEKIIQALSEYLKRDASTIKASHHLRDDLGLDSMAVIELLYKIEETFDLQIPDQDLVGLATVGSVASYVEGRLAPAKPVAKKASKPTATKSPTKRKAKS
ncbi:MAG: acyl carrier protein [Nitrospira sp.]|nr:acyl carrier protein [Nitrospira sp.]